MVMTGMAAVWGGDRGRGDCFCMTNADIVRMVSGGRGGRALIFAGNNLTRALVSGIVFISGY
jgi:hypothetical protein